MSIPHHQTIVRFILVASLVCALTVLAWPSLAQAGSALPPRGTPPATPSADGADEKDDNRDTPPGAYIELQTQSGRAGLWAVVQWQDNLGGWHDVEGWRGALAVSGYQRWWVAAKDFDTGPFRWLVTESPGGRVLGVSASYNLPHAAKETVRVEVALGP